MIQARAQVVHNFTSKHAEPGRDDTALVVLNSLQEQLFVVLWDDGVFALLKKDTNLGLEGSGCSRLSVLASQILRQKPYPTE